jgi:hypothetical protein
MVHFRLLGLPNLNKIAILATDAGSLLAAFAGQPEYSGLDIAAETAIISDCGPCFAALRRGVRCGLHDRRKLDF